ncbi:MAG: hypothetical protein ACXADY_05905 [Candidatus Hodarchaeales archaeon]
MGIIIIAIYLVLMFLLALFDTVTGVSFEISIIFAINSSAFGIAFLVVAYGLFTMRRWAYPIGQLVVLLNWVSIIVLGVLDILIPDTTISGGTDPTFWFGTFIVTAILMYYLYLKKEFFTR